MTTVNKNLLLATYGALLVIWSLISWRLRPLKQEWDFTPKWHVRLVPAFRTFFLLSLPMEIMLTDRNFIPALYCLGLVGCLIWLGVRGRFVERAAQPLSAFSSITYNVYYIANLICFGLLMHSFVCLSILINISAGFLFVRIKHYQALTKTIVTRD